MKKPVVVIQIIAVYLYNISIILFIPVRLFTENQKVFLIWLMAIFGDRKSVFMHHYIMSYIK